MDEQLRNMTKEIIRLTSLPKSEEHRLIAFWEAKVSLSFSTQPSTEGSDEPYSPQSDRHED